MPIDNPRRDIVKSATSIDLWMNCNRKAAWAYICGYREPQGPAQELGDRVHKYLEWLKKTPGALPDRTTEVGAIAAEALPYVEHLDLAAGAVIEGQFSFRSERHNWTGFKDIKLPGREVWDYKTSSDPTKWAKTPEALLGDVQAMLYAEHEFRQHPGLETIDLTWLYLATRKPYRGKPVSITVPRHHAAECFRAIEGLADELQAAANAAPTDIVERHKYVLEVIQPNYEFCNAYRKPCAHTARCNPPLFTNEHQETKPMNLLERLQAMDALNGGPANAAPEPVTGDTRTFADIAALNTGGAASAPITHIATPTGAGGAGPIPMVYAAGPLATLQPGPMPAPPPAAINPPPRRGPGRPKKTDTIPAAPPAYVAAAAAVLPAPEVASAAPPAALLPVGAPAAAPPHAVEAPLPAPAKSHRLDALYVGCMPMVGNTLSTMPAPVSFDTLVARAKEMITLPVYFAGFGYKSNGLLLEAVQRIIEADRPQAVLVFDPRTPEATLCLSHLRSISNMQVESVRQ